MASLIGTTIEFYDFYVYATAAVLSFPPSLPHRRRHDRPAVVLRGLRRRHGRARPIVAIVFGHFGDRFGRKATLVASLLTMEIATFLIGLLPTYQAISRPSLARPTPAASASSPSLRSSGTTGSSSSSARSSCSPPTCCSTNFTLAYGTKPTSLETASAASAAAEAAEKPFDATAFAAQFYPGQGFGYTPFAIMQIVGVVFFGIFTLVSGPGRTRSYAARSFSGSRARSSCSASPSPSSSPAVDARPNSRPRTPRRSSSSGSSHGPNLRPMGALLPDLFPTNVRYSGSAIAYNLLDPRAAVAPLIAVELWRIVGGSP